jgi:hypothetical protein
MLTKGRSAFKDEVTTLMVLPRILRHFNVKGALDPLHNGFLGRQGDGHGVVVPTGNKDRVGAGDPPKACRKKLILSRGN